MAIETSGQHPARAPNAKTDTTSQAGRNDPPLAKQHTGNSLISPDTVTLTDNASQLHKLETRIAALPVVDASRVEGVKRSILSGQFQFDPQRVAEKMLSFETARSRLA